MNVLRWLKAYVVVYIRMLSTMNSERLTYAAAIMLVAIIAALLGPACTVALLVVSVLVLPALNPEVKQEIDRELRKSKF